jgi:SOS-response transcriptional repressor LexA
MTPPPPPRVRPNRGPSTGPDPTPAQAVFFTYLFTETAAHGYQPSFRELCEHFGWATPNAVMCHVRALRHKGWIAATGRGQSRAFRFLRCPDGSPFRGFVAVVGED